MNNEMNNGLGPNTISTPEQPVQSVPTTPVQPVAPTPVAPTPAEPVVPVAPVVEPVQQPVQPQPVPTPVPTPVQQPVPVETPPVPPMEPPTTPPTNDVVNMQPEEKPKKKSKILLIIPIIIVVLGLLGFVGFKVLLNDKAVMKLEVKLLSKGANTALEAMLKKADTEEDKAVVGYKGELTIDSDYKTNGIDLSKLKNYKLSYNTVTDPVKNQMSAHLTLTNQTLPVADVQALVDGDTAYVALGDLLNKVIKMDASEYHLNANKDNTESIKAMQTLINKTEPILEKYIDQQEITKSKEERTINKNTKKYNKVSAEFNITELEKYIYEAYVKDDEVIKALSVLLNEEESKVKESLNESLKNINTEDATKVTLNTYKTTFSTSPVETEIIFDNGTESNTIIVIDTVKDSNEYHIYSGETELYNGTFTDDTITFKDTQGTMDASLTVKDEDFNGSFNYNTEEMSFKSTFDSKTKNDTTTTNVKVTITAGEETFNVTVNNKLEKVKDAKIEELDTTTAVAMEELTDMDMYMLQNAYQQKLNLLLYDFMTVQYRMDNNILQ